MSRKIETLSAVIEQHLLKYGLHDENANWEIRKSDLGGCGVFARRGIDVGEAIFKDYPIILGPRSRTNCEICAICYSTCNLKLCNKECGLKMCSDLCENSSKHKKECEIIKSWQTKKIGEELSNLLTKVLAPIRSVVLSNQDKELILLLKAHRFVHQEWEVDLMKNTLYLNLPEEQEKIMRLTCCVMDSNAFEVVVETKNNNHSNLQSVRGLYPLGSLANHSCFPNTMHVFDNHQIMIVRATRFIPKDAQIFHSYTRLIWGTSTRRYHLLRTKRFLCCCERCQDPTEFGTYINSVLCKICKKGNVVPVNPLKSKEKTQWQCETCKKIVKNSDIAATTSLLGSVLNSFENEDVPHMLRFITKKLTQLVPNSYEAAVEMKYKLIWILGYHENYGYSGTKM